MYYIQRKTKDIGPASLETVDQFETLKEAKSMLLEYGLSDPAGEYYISTRACKGWTLNSTS